MRLFEVIAEKMTAAAISFGCAAPVRLDVVVQTTPSPKHVCHQEHTKNCHQRNIQKHHNLQNEGPIRVNERGLEQTVIDRNDCGADAHEVDRGEDT